jgi:hypothetical protein
MRSVSISVPARNVRRMPPKAARYDIQPSTCITPRFPKRTPKISSIMATERPNRNETKLASKIAIPTSNGVASGYMVTPSVGVRIA